MATVRVVSTLIVVIIVSIAAVFVVAIVVVCRLNDDLLLLLLESLGHRLDQVESLLALVAHQTHRAGVDYVKELLQVQRAHVGRVLEVAVKVGVKFVLLVS